MANTNTDGPSPVRRTRSANDVDAVASWQSASTAGQVVGGGPSRTAMLDNAPSLASLTPASGVAGVGTTTCLPTLTSSGETSTIFNNSDPMEASALSTPTFTYIQQQQQQPAPPTPAAPNAAARPQQPRANRSSYLHRALEFVGLGANVSEARKSQISMVQELVWGFAQISTITIIVALSGTIWNNPAMPDQTEWEACDRPLGIWACLWAGRAVLATVLGFWDYKRSQARLALQQPEDQAAAETGTLAASPGTPPVNRSWATSSPYETQNNAPEQQVSLPYSLLYSRLTLFSSLITLGWFLTAHILEYTSLSTCRHTSPHLWWLIFGILCIMYIMVLEVLLLGFICLIVAPILFVFWNIFLFCIGRHPAQNPHMIKPDVGKLNKAAVDRIPLVMYIPPPPTLEPASAPTTPESQPKDKEVGIAEPAPSHEYPPTPSAPRAPKQGAVVQPPKRNRFRFFKRKASSSEHVSEGDVEADCEKGQSWEDQYEKGEHPFVVLEGNRAACAICLMDFEPPKRKDEATGGPAPTPVSAVATSPSSGGSEPDRLRLEDSGEGAQPLRLLGCGHVFHQTCLDPWLTDVSGRCPVCQRRIQESDLLKKKGRRQQ